MAYRNRNNRFFAALLCMACAAVLALPAGVYAVPASPVVHDLKQADGSTIKAVQWGDENMHGWQTQDGYTIVFDEWKGSWAYADLSADGSLVSSAYVVGKDAPPAHVQKKLRPAVPAGADVPVKRTTKEMAVGASSETSSEAPSADLKAAAPTDMQGPALIVPPTGTANIPVILINFSNTSTTYTPAQFDTLLFGTSTFSMKDYYNEVSYGNFSVSPGLAGISGWYTALYGHDYYGANDPYYGIDRKPGTLVREAVIAADPTVDFSQYDMDFDCYVDVVAIVHQGTGEETGWSPTDIWSHRWTLKSAYAYGFSNGGVYTTNDTCIANPAVKMKVNDYIIMPEQYDPASMSTIGVFAHEYGHSLGLPDLYDTDYSSNGVGYWSLMAAGSWNYVTDRGDRPAHMDAWSKYQLGWVLPMRVTGTLTNESITAAATAADVYQLGTGAPLSGEYFLVENRQKSGFDAGLPAAGLLIWHIDGGYINTHVKTNNVNNNECFNDTYWNYYYCTAKRHYGVALVQADNQYDLEWGTYFGGNSGDPGDPFPGSTNKTGFNNTSDFYNNSKYYNGLSNNISVSAISASAATMTATLYAPQPSIGEAVDNVEVTWYNGDPPKFANSAADWFGQDLVSYDGVDAAQSGAIGHGQYSVMSTKVGLSAPGSLSFFWKVSSQAGYDLLKFFIDGVQKAAISGEKDWQQKSYALAAGNHTLTWVYSKNASVSGGADAGWVDKVEINSLAKAVLLSPNGREKFQAGSVTTITWEDAPAAAEKYKLFYSINNGLSYLPITPDYVTGTSYDWTVPAPNGNKTGCRVKVVAYNAVGAVVGSDVSNAPFTIEVFKITYPNGGETLVSGTQDEIKFDIYGLTTVANMVFYYTLDGGVSWKQFLPVPGQSWTWQVPVVTAPKTKCKMKIVLKNLAGGVLATDLSDGFFTINPQ